MVNFSVFNELSLPFETNYREVENSFIEFFKCLSALKEKNLKSLRMDKDFKEFEIIKGVYFREFFGKIKQRELKQRLKSFITNGILIIHSPLLDEEDEENLLDKEYSYNGENPFIGGLACCEMWNTISVSFNSSDKWNNVFLEIEKDNKNVKVRNISTKKHLELHKSFFKQIEEEQRLEISQKNFWENREKYFPNKIVFCKEVKKQIDKIDPIVFKQAISILRDLESGRKKINDYSSSFESSSVENDYKLKKLRMFTINDEKIFFTNHLKNLSKANRIYFLEDDNKIYIGYIGTHLPTKLFK
jgi:hypothetical protein